MTQNELELLEGLRALAAAEPRAASPVVEQRLVASFRARATRRRRRIWGSAIGAFAAAAAGVALFLWAPSIKQSKIVARSTQPAAVSKLHEAIVSPEPDNSDVPQTRFAVVRTDDVASSFYPLPEAADLPAIETAMVVRVEMPASSLQFMGVPLGGDLTADPVEADVLLGQDGLARGVRLIQ